MCGCGKAHSHRDHVYKFLFSFLLFLVLSPGILITLPPLSKGLLYSGQTSLQAAVIHALLFALLYRILSHVYWSIRRRMQVKRMVRFAHDLEQHAQTAALYDIYNLQADQARSLRDVANRCQAGAAAPPAK